jgi:membrane protein YdbS with pleckstrin-like domain
MSSDEQRAALPGDDTSSRQRLPARTTTYWRVRALITGAIVVGLATWGAVGLSWPGPIVRWIVVGLLAVWLLVIGVGFGPPIRRRLFWYALSEIELDVQHGWLTQTRTVVPMSRVQHLKSEQGLLARRFRVADLHLHTAAGTVVVKGLDQDEAVAVRARIGLLAQVADDL